MSNFITIKTRKSLMPGAIIIKGKRKYRIVASGELDRRNDRNVYSHSAIEIVLTKQN
jgi:hypothetical protein